jgi:hypothetical protein
MLQQRVFVALLAVVLPAAAAFACSSILGFRDLTLLDAGDDGAADVRLSDGADAGTGETGGDGGSGCMAQRWPDNPMGGPSGGDASFVVAFDSLDFAYTDPIGFDLDNVCTCVGDAGSSCVTPSGGRACDQPGGRDVYGNILLNGLGTEFDALAPQTLNGDVSAGDFGVLLEVDNYNGESNDQGVTVKAFASPGTTQQPPRHDGTDVWYVAPDSVVGGSTMPPYAAPKYQTFDAYVVDYVLVAHLSGGFGLVARPNAGGANNPVTLNLSDLWLSGTLVPPGDGGGWTITKGNVGARWPISRVLDDIHALSGSNGESLCGTDPYYVIAKSMICGALDIASNPSADNTGVPCDALGLGIGFTGEPAIIGDVLPLNPIINCPDAASSCAPDGG